MSQHWDPIRQWIGENHKSLGLAVGAVLVTWKVAPVVTQTLAAYKQKRALKKWAEAPTPRDVVIVHTLNRGKTIPNLSPMSMKLETFLRIAKIPYEMDFGTPLGPLGKMPWITLNGEHMADSQLIIRFLTDKYKVKLGNYTDEQKALARAVRIMMDEYLYWGIGLWRYVHSEGKGLTEIFDISPLVLKMFYKRFSKRVSDMAWGQGIGRHSKQQVIEMMKETLKNASLLLGDKDFLLGDEPCEEDCTLFGMLGMVRWAAPGSPYEAYMNDELPNLKDYCDRMKTRFWGNWDQCLAQSK